MFRYVHGLQLSAGSPPSPSALHSHRFLPRRCAMGKHFTGGELDLMHKLKGQGLAVNDIHRHLCSVRTRMGHGLP